jgi:phosphatidate cytidylyltransferase
LEKEYKKNLFTRAITALAIALPIILIILIENFWLFSVTISVICLLGYYEWVTNKFRHPLLWGFNLIFSYFLLLIILTAGDFIFKEASEEPILSFYYIFLLSLFNTAIFDTSAYITGSSIGKNPIAPKISPNKTWEGLVGGLIGSIIFSIFVIKFFDLSLWLTLVYFLGSILAFVGDLLISFHKREKNIKDTGSLLPGHGGVLDRLDSHLLATPITVILTILLA